MRLVALAIITAGLCICAAVADASPSISAAARLEWNLWAAAALVMLIIAFLSGWK